MSASQSVAGWVEREMIGEMVGVKTGDTPVPDAGDTALIMTP